MGNWGYNPYKWSYNPYLQLVRGPPLIGFWNILDTRIPHHLQDTGLYKALVKSQDIEEELTKIRNLIRKRSLIRDACVVCGEWCDVEVKTIAMLDAGFCSVNRCKQDEIANTHGTPDFFSEQELRFGSNAFF